MSGERPLTRAVHLLDEALVAIAAVRQILADQRADTGKLERVLPGDVAKRKGVVVARGAKARRR